DLPGQSSVAPGPEDAADDWQLEHEDVRRRALPTEEPVASPGDADRLVGGDPRERAELPEAVEVVRRDGLLHVLQPGGGEGLEARAGLGLGPGAVAVDADAHVGPDRRAHRREP